MPVAKALSKYYSIALLSNDVSEWSDYLRKKHALDFLDSTIISGDVRCRKPDPAIFERFLTDSGAKAEECIFVDDRGNNLCAAQAMGLRTIHFLRQPQQELEDAIEHTHDDTFCGDRT